MHIELEAALRVLSCYRDGTAPNPEDLLLILEAADYQDRQQPPDELAVEIVNREIKLLRRSVAGEDRHGMSPRLHGGDMFG